MIPLDISSYSTITFLVNLCYENLSLFGHPCFITIYWEFCCTSFVISSLIHASTFTWSLNLLSVTWNLIGCNFLSQFQYHTLPWDYMQPFIATGLLQSFLNKRKLHKAVISFPDIAENGAVSDWFDSSDGLSE